jgi:hypothetical protein
MALAPASVVLVGLLFGQSSEAVKPIVPVGTPPPDTPSSLLAPVGAPEPEPAREIVLQPTKDGSGDLMYDGSNFRARVARDGSVKFDDKRVTGLTPLPWMPQPVRYGVPSLQSSLVMALRGQPPPPAPPRDTSGPPPETTQLIPDVTRYRPDAREQCWRCSLDYQQPALVSALGRFDVTDELVRMNGQDPHRVEKATFLAATRDVRVTMAAGMHAANIRQAMADLPARLETIACDPWLSTAEKRGILMALRAEMNGSAEGRAAGARISEVLTRFDSSNGDAGQCPRKP